MLFLLLVGCAYSISVSCTLRTMFTWRSRTIWPFDSLCVDGEKSNSVLTGMEIQFIDVNGVSDVGINDTKQCKICVRSVQIDYTVDDKGKERAVYRGFITGCADDGMKYLIHTIDMVNVHDEVAAHELLKQSFPVDKPVYCLPQVLRGTRPWETTQQK